MALRQKPRTRQLSMWPIWILDLSWQTKFYAELFPTMRAYCWAPSSKDALDAFSQAGSAS